MKKRYLENIKWPNNARCTVVFSFDVDITAGWKHVLRRNNIERDDPVVLSQGEYSVRRGISRVLKTLSNYNIKGTFFIPGINIEKYPEISVIHKEAHEIAAHGYRHIVPTKLEYLEEKEEIGKGVELLTKKFGIKVLGYRSPGEGLTDSTLKLLIENGLIYDSSMMDDDLPYIVEVGDKKIVELPWRWVMDDWTYFGFNYFPPLEYRKCGPENPRLALEVWKDEFDIIYEEGLYIMFLAHPQQIGQPSRIKALRNFIEYVMSHDNVWITTAGELANYIKNIYIKE